MKAIIFARVSTEEQREAGNSLPAQTSRIEKYAEQKDFDVIEIYSFDESAYKQKRDEFDRILERINQSNEKIAICFDKVDRLSRNVFDKRVGTLYEKAIEGEIELHFVSDGQIISTHMSAVEKFQFGMSLGLAKYYSDAISDNVKRAYEKMRREGKWTAMAPLGYINTEDSGGNKDIIPHPEKSFLIQRLFKLYATGNHSITTLHNEALEIGLTNHRGDPVNRSVIDKILQNTFYHGIAPSKLHGSYPHKYEPIITRDLFKKCIEVRSGRSKSQTKLNTEKPFIFKGLLKCDNCGCAISGDLKTKPSGLQYIYYSCSNAKRICKREHVNENTLLEPLTELFEAFKAIPDDTTERIMAGLRETNESEKAYHHKQVSRINIEIKKYQTLIDHLADKYIEEKIEEDIYLRKMKQYKEKKSQLEEDLLAHSSADHEFKITIPVVKSISSRIGEIFESSKPHEKRAILNYLLSNPVLKEKKLYFTIASPFSELLELSNNPDWLRTVEAVRTWISGNIEYYVPNI